MKGAVVVFGVVSNDNHASMLLAAALVEKAQESPSSRGVKAIVLAPKTNLPSRTCSGHLCEKFQESSRSQSYPGAAAKRQSMLAFDLDHDGAAFLGLPFSRVRRASSRSTI
jgi:hypothetical protein